MTRNWVCRACGEKGDEATEPPRYLSSGNTCLADQGWYSERYPRMKHHWSDGTPLSLDDGLFWYAVSAPGGGQDE
jgi:hypothetical protein